MRRRRPRRIRVGFFGVLGSGNLGNDGSLDVLVSFLRPRHPDVVVDFCAMGPQVLESRYDAKAVSLQWYEAHAARFSAVPTPALKVIGRLLDPFRTLVWVGRHDVVLVPGMGVLETTAPSRPWGLPLSMLCLAVAGRLTHTRVGLVSVGADLIPNPVTRYLLATTARLAHFRSYRDELSRDAMLAMGVDAARSDEVYPDLAFALLAPPARTTDARSIAVGVMNFRGAEEDRPRAQELHERYVADIERLVAALLDDGWHVRLFGGDAEDEAVIERVAAAMSGTATSSGVVTTVRCSSMADVMDTLAEVRLAVATRYHSVQGALRMCVPTVSIGYARKSDALMESMGLGGYCHHAGAIDVDRVIDALRDLDARHDEVRCMLARRNAEQSRALDRQFDALSVLVRSAAGTGSQSALTYDARPLPARPVASPRRRK